MSHPGLPQEGHVVHDYNALVPLLSDQISYAPLNCPLQERPPLLQDHFFNAEGVVYKRETIIIMFRAIGNIGGGGGPPSHINVIDWYVIVKKVI